MAHGRRVFKGINIIGSVQAAKKKLRLPQKYGLLHEAAQPFLPGSSEWASKITGGLLWLSRPCHPATATTPFQRLQAAHGAAGTID